MAGLRRRSENEQPVYGVAHLLSHSDFMRVLVTEGGGVAYSVLEADGLDSEGRLVRVQTLVARVESSFAKGRHPSRRYMVCLMHRNTVDMLTYLGVAPKWCNGMRAST